MKAEIKMLFSTIIGKSSWSKAIAMEKLYLLFRFDVKGQVATFMDEISIHNICGVRCLVVALTKAVNN